MIRLVLLASFLSLCSASACSTSVGQLGCSTNCPDREWACNCRFDICHNHCTFVPHCYNRGGKPICECKTQGLSKSDEHPQSKTNSAPPVLTPVFLAIGSLLLAFSVAMARPFLSRNPEPLAHQDGTQTETPHASRVDSSGDSGDTSGRTTCKRVPISIWTFCLSVVCFAGAAATIAFASPQSNSDAKQIDQQLKAVIHAVSQDTTIQSIATQSDLPTDLQVFQDIFQHELDLVESHSVQVNHVSATSLIGDELGLHDTIALDNFRDVHLAHCPPGSVLAIQTVEASEDYSAGVLSTAILLCQEIQESDVSLWFSSGSSGTLIAEKHTTSPRAVMISEITPNGMYVRFQESQGFSAEARDGASKLGLLLAVTGMTHGLDQ